jgi:hypothetical protein
MFREECQHYLCGCAHDAAACHVSTEHYTARVGNSHVQVRPIGRNRPSERQYFQVATQLGRVLRPGKSQLRDAQAPNALDHEGRTQAKLAQRVFENGAQVIAGEQPQRMCFHHSVPGWQRTAGVRFQQAAVPHIVPSVSNAVVIDGKKACGFISAKWAISRPQQKSYGKADFYHPNLSSTPT